MFNLKRLIRSGRLSDDALTKLRSGCVVWPDTECVAMIDSAERTAATKCVFRMRTVLCGCGACAPEEVVDSSISISYPTSGEEGGRIIVEYDQAGRHLVQTGFFGTGESDQPKSVEIEFPGKLATWFLKFEGGVLVRTPSEDDPPTPQGVLIYWPPARDVVDSSQHGQQVYMDPTKHRWGSFIRIGRPRGGPSKRLAHRHP